MHDGTDRAIGRVALVLSIVAILGVAITGWLALRSGSAAPPAYRAGDIVDLPSRYFEGHAASVVIVVKTGCPACERSSAFHTALREAAASAGLGVSTVVADEVAPSTLGRIHVAPSVLLLDRNGRVLEMKEGALPENEQRALIERVRKIPGT
jgi:hypothetical protein